tara:strand:- start:100 stop:273 length:174 start_codon:yes stop_codon:yes gene_type:complete
LGALYPQISKTYNFGEKNPWIRRGCARFAVRKAKLRLTISLAEQKSAASNQENMGTT